MVLSLHLEKEKVWSEKGAYVQYLKNYRSGRGRKREDKGKGRAERGLKANFTRNWVLSNYNGQACTGE